MSITVKCPECRATLAVAEPATGERLRCPHCQSVLRLPDEMGTNPPPLAAQQGPASGREPARRAQPRLHADAPRMRVDNLNNQAVSLLNLGKPLGAEQLLDKLLRLAPNHPQAIFNRGLLQWRSGRVTDLGLLRQFEELRAASPGDWQPMLFLGLVHAERGDLQAAVGLLEEAIRRGAGPDVQTVLGRIRSLLTQTVRCVQVLPGHLRMVKAVCLSEDARHALSGSGDGTLRLWDLASGECLQTIHTTNEACECLVMAPDGRWALAGHDNVAMYDLGTGQCLRTFEGHVQPVTALSLSADGALALSGSGDKTVRLWEVATGRCLQTFEGHASPITCVDLSADGRVALSGCSARQLWMWDVSNAKRVRTFEGQEFGPECVRLSRDGRWVVTGDADAKLHVFSTKNGLRVRTLRGHQNKVTSVCLSADGRWALSGSLDETLRMWDLTSGCCVRTLEGHSSYVLSVSLSADGRLALSGSGSPADPKDNTVRVWDFEVFHRPGGRYLAPPARCAVAGKEEAKPGQARFDGMLLHARSLADARRFDEALYVIEQARKIPSFGLSPPALDLRAAVGEHGIRERFRDGRCTRTLRASASSVGSVALSPDASRVVTGGSDKLVRLWDLARGECDLTLAGHSGPVNDVCFTPDGRQALSASEDGTVRVWDLASAACRLVLEGHGSWVSSVAVSPDGRWAVSGARDKTLRLWDLATGTCVRTLTGHAGLVRSLRFSACARWLLSGAFDKTLRLWDVATGQCLRTFEGHTDIVHSVGLSADARWAVSAGNDKSVRLWDVRTGQCARVMQEHFERVLSVAMTADGRWALSASGDKLLRLWNLAQGQCAQVLSGHTAVVTCADMSPDGRWLVSASHDQTVRFWECEWDYSFPEPADWEEDARPYVENFLVLHTPYEGDLPQGRGPTDDEARRALTRAGKPSWTEDDFQKLLLTLRTVGFGWLQPDGVRRRLEQLASER